MKRRSNEVLRITRLSRRLSLREMAVVCGKSKSYAHRLEAGGCAKLTPEVAARVASTLGLPVGILFPGESSQ
jgi:transcriptional regulator with XRE-family HTH domain